MRVVALDDPWRAIVFKGQDRIQPALVDYRVGTVELLPALPNRFSDPRLDYGRGNPQVRIDDRRVVLASNQGLVVVDTRTGGVAYADGRSRPEGQFTNFCCSVAYDARRDRLLELQGTSADLGGRVVVYRIVD